MAERLGFVADAKGTVAELVLSDQVSRAYDIMTAGNVPAETAAEMVTAAERSGKDPVAFAEHFVGLRKGMRAYSCSSPAMSAQQPMTLLTAVKNPQRS